MADNLQATPRNQLLGLLSDAMYGGLDWMKSPERTQQMQGLAGLLESTGIPQTTQRMAYGEPLTNIGRANVPLLKPETAEAMMNVAPFAPAVGRLASRAVKATEGLPVGMSIKDVGKNIFEDATKYHQKVPEIKSINVAKLKRMNAGEVADVSDEVAAKMDFSEPIKVSVFADGELRIVDGHHRVAAAKKLGIKSLPVELQAINAKGSTLNKLAQEATYPQQAALDLAQQRAALPVEQGGLGLPANNTAMDRAKAMGTDVETSYIHSTSNPFTKINEDGKFSGIFTLPNYSANYGTLNMPLVVRGEIATSDDLRRLVKKPTKKMQMAIDERIPENVDVADATVEMQKLRNELARKHGFSGVKVSDEFGQDTTALVNPANIRSRFAAFDPFRKDVATATAMGVALPDLLAAEPIPQPQSSGLLYPFP